MDQNYIINEQQQHYINTNIMFLDIIHSLFLSKTPYCFYLKKNGV
jgi:hypothetical protein